MKLLSLLLILITTTLCAETPIKRKIDRIDYRAQSGSTVVLIKLSDGSTWKWQPDRFSENFIRTWSRGDQVIIGVGNNPGFTIQNIANSRYIPTVALTFNSYTLFPQISRLSESKKFIELTDGTKWKLLYDFNMRDLTHWSAGDHVIPVAGIKDNFELINIDIPHENRSAIHRHLQFVSYEEEEEDLYIDEESIIDPLEEDQPAIIFEENSLSANS